MAFVRRKGNSYYLVHNVRRRGKVRQLHLAPLGHRPRITDEVVRQVSRSHPLLDLDWPRLRETVSRGVQIYDSDSPHVLELMHSLRSLNLDLAELSPPLVTLAGEGGASNELVTQLRLLRSTLDIKLHQFGRAVSRNSGANRKFR